jgi:hypothetical protein
MAWNWYTKGRRIPTLIGKDVSGRRIPGGPYTGLQAVTAAAVPALLWSTRSLWAADMATGPAAGTLAGRKLAELNPHRVACAIEVTHASLDDIPAAGLPATEQTPLVTATPDAAVPSGLPAAAVDEAETAVAEAVATTSARPSNQPAPVAVSLRPAAPLAPDRRRTGLEAFLAGAAAGRDTNTEEDAA